MDGASAKFVLVLVGRDSGWSLFRGGRSVIFNQPEKFTMLFVLYVRPGTLGFSIFLVQKRSFSVPNQLGHVSGDQVEPGPDQIQSGLLEQNSGSLLEQRRNRSGLLN